MEQFDFIVQKAFSRDVYPVEWVQVVAPDGSLLIGPGHQRLVTAVKDGESITYSSGGVEKTLEVKNGMLHAYSDKVVLLVG